MKNLDQRKLVDKHTLDVLKDYRTCGPYCPICDEPLPRRNEFAKCEKCNVWKPTNEEDLGDWIVGLLSVFIGCACFCSALAEGHWYSWAGASFCLFIFVCCVVDIIKTDLNCCKYFRLRYKRDNEN